jgi:hypothetical protein
MPSKSIDKLSAFHLASSRRAEIGQILGLARCRDEAMAGGEHGFGKLATEAA